MKKFLWFVILTVVVVKLSIYIASNQNFFLRKFDPVYMGNLYSQSQYIIGEKSKGGIGDDGLYAFAGYYYLFQKGDVSSVNFEHPPLGKYLIGLSIFLFGNENVINLFYFLILLIFTYRMGKMIIQNNLLSLLSVGIIAFDPLFLDNLIRSLLDLPFTLFFTAGIYFFLKALKNVRLFYISMFFWGSAFSTRFFPAFIIIYCYMFIVILIINRKLFFPFIQSSFLIPVVYIVSHISFFIFHPSIIEFLRHKKWMLSWFTGTPVLVGNIWRNIFTGTYLDSTRKLTINQYWTPLVAIVTILSLTHLRKVIFHKNFRNLLVLYGICLIYLLYLTILTGGMQKFLMPIYPSLSILAVSNLALIYSIINAWCKKTSLLSKGK